MSSDYQWHVERRKKILEKYPQIRHYLGNYPWSIVPIAFLVALQWLMAWLVSDLPWWMVGLISFFVGQFILHSLSTFIHEAAHNLILKGRVGSVISLLLIELGTLSFGKSLTYVSEHGPSHHLHLNDYMKDYEWWDRNQVELLRYKVLWRSLEGFLHLFPGGPIIADLIVSQIVLPDARRQIKRAKTPVAVTALFIATSAILYALAWVLIGGKASLYLFWSLSLMVSYWGITFSGQSIAEHHIYQNGKTYSTYHWTNILFFNTGYHDEHHTFPDVPWVYLPKIKQIAPEYFTNDSPYSYFKWWWLWAKSIFEPDRYNRYSPGEPSSSPHQF
jgi:sphingolipid delta-4 desaturase